MITYRVRFMDTGNMGDPFEAKVLVSIGDHVDIGGDPYYVVAIYHRPEGPVLWLDLDEELLFTD